MTDLIGRQAAIDALLEKGQRSRRYKVGEIWELNFDEIREALATVPSAEPKKGKWIISKVNGQYQCSNCGMFTGLTAEDIESGFYLMKYCGNCGARMDKDD